MAFTCFTLAFMRQAWHEFDFYAVKIELRMRKKGRDELKIMFEFLKQLSVYEKFRGLQGWFGDCVTLTHI
jgi:hypothetical protein